MEEIKNNNENKVIYELDSEPPHEGQIIINRDKDFLPIKHELSDGIARRWIVGEHLYDEFGKIKSTYYGLLDE